MSDFEYEFQMALTNKELNPEPGNTVFDHQGGEYVLEVPVLSSQIASFGGDISNFVPACILDNHSRKIMPRKKESSDKKSNGRRTD